MTRDEKIKFIEDTIKSLTGRDVKITENVTLESLGIDSLEIVELQMAYEDAKGVSLDETGAAIETIEDLIALMK